MGRHFEVRAAAMKRRTAISFIKAIVARMAKAFLQWRDGISISIGVLWPFAEA